MARETAVAVPGMDAITAVMVVVVAMVSAPRDSLVAEVATSKTDDNK